MPDVPVSHLAPTQTPVTDWPGPMLPPFRAVETREVDARQGPGSGRQAWVVEDALGRHVVGLFLDFPVAQIWAMAIAAVFEAGRQKGIRECSQPLSRRSSDEYRK